MLNPIELNKIGILDAREKNYTRRDVTNDISLNLPNATVFTYIGKKEAVNTYETGFNNNNAIINKKYKETVEQGFAKLGAHEYSKFIQSTKEPSVPIMALNEIKIW